MPKELLVIGGSGEFKITVPDDAKITFGPFSPPSRSSNGGGFGNTSFNPVGTLRVYQGTKDNIIACFTNVESFRTLDLDYSEKIAVEEGSSLWKSDQDGYREENKVSRVATWVDTAIPALPAGKPKAKKKK